MSEEAANASVAIPTAIVCGSRKLTNSPAYANQMGSIVATCTLGWGMDSRKYYSDLMVFYLLGVIIALAFCMGTDLNAILNSTTGQPMAQILYNSLGQRGALVAWCLIIAGQYVLSAHLVA